MAHNNTNKRAKSNRDFARSALKIIYSVLPIILFPKELLKSLLEARGSYLSRLGNEGRRALRDLDRIDVEDVRTALKKLGKKILRETRDRRVAIDFHSIPQYHKSKSLLSKIKPTKGTSWGLVQAALFLLGRKNVFLDVIPITVKKIAEDFRAAMEVLTEELDRLDLRLVMVFADRESAVNEVIKYLLDLGVEFVIAKSKMYEKYLGQLEEVDVRYAGVRYTGFLLVRHVSGAYLVLLRKDGDDDVVGFLVWREVDVHGAVVFAEMYRERWGVENAFGSLEEFRVRSRTCDVRKELVLVLISYLLLNVWFLVRSWRRVRLWEFAESIVGYLVPKEIEEASATASPQAEELSFVNFS
ncbi:transposase [Sulfolobus tengchongensis]|uniref:transposase n=1 Tax=Sulfolobaceae TaxID=118883 RepID=UPI001F062289|nr:MULTISPECIES: transposase [Sulfolobaceae]MCH1772288.1 transposase [Metallosphaera sedula]MCH4816856.1 transposase [Saccharolobus shibatae]